jgi:hypothetical protein
MVAGFCTQLRVLKMLFIDPQQRPTSYFSGTKGALHGFKDFLDIKGLKGTYSLWVIV